MVIVPVVHSKTTFVTVNRDLQWHGLLVLMDSKTTFVTVNHSS